MRRGGYSVMAALEIVVLLERVQIPLATPTCEGKSKLYL